MRLARPLCQKKRMLPPEFWLRSSSSYGVVGRNESSCSAVGSSRPLPLSGRVVPTFLCLATTLTSPILLVGVFRVWAEPGHRSGSEGVAEGQSGLRPTYHGQKRGTSATQMGFSLAEGHSCVLRTSWYSLACPNCLDSHLSRYWNNRRPAGLVRLAVAVLPLD